MNKIVLIGGPPRSGKTSLAQKISKEEGISWISTDAFDDIAKKYVPEVDRDELFPKSALRRRSGGGNDEMYATFSTQEIVAAYLKQAESVHAAIEAFILCANTEGWDYVIEGYHLTPKLMRNFESENANVSSVMLITMAAEEAIKRSVKSDTKQDWLRDQTQNQETFQKVADMIGLFSTEVKREADECGIRVIDTSQDFQTKSEEAFAYLTQ